MQDNTFEQAEEETLDTGAAEEVTVETGAAEEKTAETGAAEAKELQNVEYPEDEYFIPVRRGVESESENEDVESSASGLEEDERVQTPRQPEGDDNVGRPEENEALVPMENVNPVGSNSETETASLHSRENEVEEDESVPTPRQPEEDDLFHISPLPSEIEDELPIVPALSPQGADVGAALHGLEDPMDVNEADVREGARRDRVPRGGRGRGRRARAGRPPRVRNAGRGAGAPAGEDDNGEVNDDGGYFGTVERVNQLLDAYQRHQYRFIQRRPARQSWVAVSSAEKKYKLC